MKRKPIDWKANFEYQLTLDEEYFNEVTQYESKSTHTRKKAEFSKAVKQARRAIELIAIMRHMLAAFPPETDSEVYRALLLAYRLGDARAFVLLHAVDGFMAVEHSEGSAEGGKKKRRITPEIKAAMEQRVNELMTGKKHPPSFSRACELIGGDFSFSPEYLRTQVLTNPKPRKRKL